MDDKRIAGDISNIQECYEEILQSEIPAVMEDVLDELNEGRLPIEQQHCSAARSFYQISSGRDELKRLKEEDSVIHNCTAKLSLSGSYFSCRRLSQMKVQLI